MLVFQFSQTICLLCWRYTRPGHFANRIESVSISHNSYLAAITRLPTYYSTSSPLLSCWTLLFQKLLCWLEVLNTSLPCSNRLLGRISQGDGLVSRERGQKSVYVTNCHHSERIPMHRKKRPHQSKRVERGNRS